MTADLVDVEGLPLDPFLRLAVQLCRLELDIRALTKTTREASCSRTGPLVGLCWAREEEDDQFWCDGCKAGQAAYQARKEVRAKRAGVKRRLVNLYEKLQE